MNNQETLVPDRYAVFGHPITHSKSPRIHQLFALQTGQNLDYFKKDVAAEQFEPAVTEFFNSAGKGLNCTVPLKELAWQFADTLSERARYSKAVNTLAVQSDGSVAGDNTDGIGLVSDLTNNHNISLTAINILVLGAGGASRGIIGPLLECRPKRLVIANRTVEKAIKLADEFAALGPVDARGYKALGDQSFELILNATSASLSNQLPPLPEGLLADRGICYDLAYGNEPTAFVRWGLQQQAAESLDGLGMLVEQAAEAFFIWRGIRPDTRPIIERLNQERRPASQQVRL